jgi:endoglucanase
MRVGEIKPRRASIPPIALAFLIGAAAFAETTEAAPTPVEKYGRLQVVGARLCDARGDPVQLRGMSSAGLQWYGGIINEDSFAALARDWGCDVIRLALYVGEGGYAAHPELKDLVAEGVDLATRQGLYVILDWHVLTPGDPNDPIYSGAADFFGEMARAYGSRPNVMYEIMNEPNGELTWPKDLKPYASRLVAAIRAVDPVGIILIGSGTWSQDVDFAADDPVVGANLMYTVHFYAGTHGSILRGKISRALAEGAAVFCSEWGTSEANGTGGPYIESSEEWLKFLDDRGISWVNWSLSDKDETSAAFKAGTPLAPDVVGEGGYRIWSPERLSASGAFVRAKIKGIPFPTR